MFQLYHLSQASQIQPLGYRASILCSTLDTDQLQMPALLSAYVLAFRALHPHRLLSVSGMLPADLLNDPLFLNKQISQPSLPPKKYKKISACCQLSYTNSACLSAAFLTPQKKPPMLSAGITWVAQLRL